MAREPLIQFRMGLCPICGEEAVFDGRTTDGRWIGSCGDAFTPEQWLSDTDLTVREQITILLTHDVDPTEVVRALHRFRCIPCRT